MDASVAVVGLFLFGNLDGPVIGSVSLFREIPRLCCNPSKSIALIDSTSYLLLLDLRPLAVAIQVLTLGASVG